MRVYINSFLIFFRSLLSKLLNIFGYETKEKKFVKAFDIFKNEFYQNIKERDRYKYREVSDKMRKSEDGWHYDPYMLRNNAEDDYIKAISSDYIEGIENTIIPYCDIISRNNIKLVKEFYEDVIVSKREQAKNGAKRFCISQGHEDFYNAIYPTIEQKYNESIYKVSNKVDSIIEQSNLRIIHERDIERRKYSKKLLLKWGLPSGGLITIIIYIVSSLIGC